jgi:hypothetical protein
MEAPSLNDVHFIYFYNALLEASVLKLPDTGGQRERVE